MIATFACGCFWTKQYRFSQVPGVTATRTGYTGGHTQQPTYAQVCRKTTGHAEAVEVTFDPTVLSFSELVQFFFTLHDPTKDRSDQGGQYRSAIFLSFGGTTAGSRTGAGQATASRVCNRPPRSWPRLLFGKRKNGTRAGASERALGSTRRKNKKGWRCCIDPALFFLI